MPEVAQKVGAGWELVLEQLAATCHLDQDSPGGSKVYMVELRSGALAGPGRQLLEVQWLRKVAEFL